ncbi:MAG: peptidylprolyl isomerase [Methylacidiphilales bacterium]|nr:peptidylprolyl isomerase [Candidatus Methylacidiphilales bacterium]
MQERLELVRKKAIAEGYLFSITSPPDNYPDDEELKSAYEANKASYLMPRQLQLAQIFIALPEDAAQFEVETAQNRLDLVQKSLNQTGADFAALARGQSDDKQSGGNGGNLGWLPESMIQPDILKQAIALSKGAVSAPIRIKDGWHIIKVLDTKEAYTASYEDMHDRLIQQLRSEKAQANRNTYFTKLLGQKQISINGPELLKALGKNPEKTPQ